MTLVPICHISSGKSFLQFICTTFIIKHCIFPYTLCQLLVKNGRRHLAFNFTAPWWHGTIFLSLCLQVQLQAQENETFSIPWVGACIYACICIDVVHPCISCICICICICVTCVNRNYISIKILEFKLHEELKITW